MWNKIYLKIFLIICVLIFGFAISLLFLYSNKESFRGDSRHTTNQKRYPFFDPENNFIKEDKPPTTQEDIEFRRYCRDFPGDLKCKKNLGISDFDYTKKIDGSQFAPSVDGKRKDLRAMSMFAFNKCDAKCEDSGYTCAHGNICLTKKQKCFINKKGF